MGVSVWQVFLSAFFLALIWDQVREFGNPGPSGPILKALPVNTLPEDRAHLPGRLLAATGGAAIVWIGVSFGLDRSLFLAGVPALAFLLGGLDRSRGTGGLPGMLELLDSLNESVGGGDDFFSALAVGIQAIPDGPARRAVLKSLAQYERHNPVDACLAPLYRGGRYLAILAAGVRRAGWEPSRGLEIVVDLAYRRAENEWARSALWRAALDPMGGLWRIARAALGGGAAACLLLLQLGSPMRGFEAILAVALAAALIRTGASRKRLYRLSAALAALWLLAPLPAAAPAQAQASAGRGYDPAQAHPDRAARFPALTSEAPRGDPLSDAAWLPVKEIPGPEAPARLSAPNRAVVWNRSASGAYLWDRPGGRITRFLENGLTLRLTERWQALGGVPFGEIALGGATGWVDMRSAHRVELPDDGFVLVRPDSWIYLYDRPAGRILLWLPPGTPLLPAAPDCPGLWCPVRLLIGEQSGWVKSAALTPAAP